MPIEIEFELSGKDYKIATRDFYLHQKSIWAMIILAEIGGAGSILWTSVFGETMEGSLQTVLLAFFLSLALVLPLAIFLYLPYQVERKVSKQGKLGIVQRWTVMDEGIEIKTEHSESKMDWEVFGGIIESSRHYLLSFSTNKNLFVIIPKRAFRTPRTATEFREIAMRHIEPKV